VRWQARGRFSTSTSNTSGETISHTLHYGVYRQLCLRTSEQAGGAENASIRKTVRNTTPANRLATHSIIDRPPFISLDPL
jgi:hypothetical protein